MVSNAPAAPESWCEPAPLGLLAELTHRCPLQCVYCSNPVQLEKINVELTTKQWLKVFEQAAGLGVLQLHLSGGEPTVRHDLEQLVEYAALQGMYTNLITAGVLLSEERIHKLVSLGLDHLQLSIQDGDPENADRISGYRGGLAPKKQVADWAVKAGLPLTINAPIHRLNIDNLETIIDFAVDARAMRLEVAHVQYYGWGLMNRSHLMPTPSQVLKSIDVVEHARGQLRGSLQIDFVTPDYFARRPKPCMDGWGRKTINVTPSGKVLPCHAAETIPGLLFENVKNVGLRDIWFYSSAFNAFRGTEWMTEPCRGCERREIDWGGCRCQAFALAGDAAATDPACALSPLHKKIKAIAVGGADQVQQDIVMRNAPNALRHQSA